jgi:hypothetical protein
MRAMSRPSMDDLREALLRRARLQYRFLVQALRTDDGRAFGIVALFSLPYLWLIWRYEFLPMQDLSGHVELSFLHDRISADDPAYTPFYRIAPQPWPNSLSTLVLSVFGAQFGFERGVKVLLSVYALAWPLSLGALAKLLGRSPLVALFAVPTILEFNWAFGFFNYLLAKPLVVASVCAAIVFARGPSLLRAALLFASVWLTFLAHGLAFLLSGVWAGLAVLCFSRGKFRLINLWPLALTLVIPIRYLLAQRDAPPAPGDWVWGTLDHGLGNVWHLLGQLNPNNDSEEKAYMLAFAAWLLSVLLTPRPSGERGEAHERTAALFVWLSGVVLFVAYARGPLNMPNVDILAERILVFAWAVLMLVPRTIPSGITRYVVGAFMVGAVGVHVYGTNEQYRLFNEVEMGGYSELIDMIPPGKSLTIMTYRHGSAFARENAMWHWPKLYTVRRGGGAHCDDTFSSRSTSYVNLTDAARAQGTYTDAPLLNLQRIAVFDYELAVGTSKETAIAHMSPVADYITSRSEWHLFRVRKP